MNIELFINFNGNCREAVEFYAEVFKTEKPAIMTFSDAPHDSSIVITKEVKNLVLHSSLNINGQDIMFSDVVPHTPFTVGNNMGLVIISDDINDIKCLFDRLKEDGIVEMDLQETFWSKYYGVLTDKFGVRWQFNLNS